MLADERHRRGDERAVTQSNHPLDVPQSGSDLLPGSTGIRTPRQARETDGWGASHCLPAIEGEHEGAAWGCRDLVRHDRPRGGINRFGIGSVDHITSNFLTLKPAIMWMEQVIGLERYWGIEFHTQDV